MEVDEFMTLSELIKCLNQAINSQKALNKLKHIQSNGIFDPELREKYKWDENKVLEHIKEELDKAISFIEGKKD